MEINTIKGENYIAFQIIGNFDQQGAMYLRNILINDYLIGETVPPDLPHVIFDFTRIESISSSGIGLLASLQRTFNKSNKLLSLTKIPHSLQQILKVANLLGVFTIYKNIEEAVANKPPLS
jgi:anti-anti-sigma factor